MNAGRDPREVNPVEIFATGVSLPTDLTALLFNPTFGPLGTTVGDPIEANAGGEGLHRSDELIVGSARDNLGYVYVIRRLLLGIDSLTTLRLRR